MKYRSLAVAALAGAALTACSASPPPAGELAIEVIDTLDVPEDVKQCMRDEVAEFGEATLDEMAGLAADGDSRGLERMEEFQAALASCM